MHRNAEVSLSSQRLMLGCVLAAAPQECQEHAAEGHQDRVLQTFAATDQLLEIVTTSALLADRALAARLQPNAEQPTSSGGTVSAQLRGIPKAPSPLQGCLRRCRAAAPLCPAAHLTPSGWPGGS